MKNFTLIAALSLCSFSWISASVSQSQTVEAQPGEEVTLQFTLLCSNFTRLPIHIYWFKLSNSSNNSCISYMMVSDGNTSFCDGFQNGKFNMKSNTTTLFLRIKQLELSDSGLYFCGFYSYGNSAIVSATYLKVQGNVVLGAVIIILVVAVTGLVNLDSDELKDATLTFYSPTIIRRRPASERAVETHVVYSACT
uniref:Ig-like domain-containing protein n=1 Tax=Sparus aurata TaxID=8175 RepID=A0A671Y0X1_SPAAU